MFVGLNISSSDSVLSSMLLRLSVGWELVRLVDSGERKLMEGAD